MTCSPEKKLSSDVLLDMCVEEEAAVVRTSQPLVWCTCSLKQKLCGGLLLDMCTEQKLCGRLVLSIRVPACKKKLWRLFCMC